jgi:hypothetical protein
MPRNWIKSSLGSIPRFFKNLWRSMAWVEPWEPPGGESPYDSRFYSEFAGILQG